MPNVPRCISTFLFGALQHLVVPTKLSVLHKAPLASALVLGVLDIVCWPREPHRKRRE